MPTSWTNHPATSNTLARAVHINELRATVNALRGPAGLAAFPWTDRTSTGALPTGSRIRAKHFSELRIAIQELWFRKLMGALPLWSAGSPPSPRRAVKASDINNPRSWVNAYETSFNPLDPQGIVSLSFFPEGGVDQSGAVIDPSWCDDAIVLKPKKNPQDKLLLIRTVAAAKGSNGSLNLAKYEEATEHWVGKGFDVGYVLPWELYPVYSEVGNTSPTDPNAPLSDGGLGLSNDYIEQFVARATTFAQAVKAKGATTFWVWNEPQVRLVASGAATQNEKDLGPQTFAALVYRTTAALKQLGGVVVYVGSLHVAPGLTDPNPGNPHIDLYLRDMYRHLRSDHNQITTYGWDALSINMEGDVTASYARRLKQTILDEATSSGDQAANPGNEDPNGSLILAEWGLRPTDANVATRITDTFNAIKDLFPTMYFFCHQHPVEEYGITDSNVRGTTNNGASPPWIYVPGSRQQPLWDTMKELYASV